MEHSKFAFSFDPLRSPVWEGWSVTYVCLQLAYWMGFSTVLLVGVDHRYQPGECNHFHPHYEHGMEPQEYDMTKALVAYRKAKAVYQKDGRRIINLTPNTKEPIFEKGQLTEWYP
jgi:hypothetical protein